MKKIGITLLMVGLLVGGYAWREYNRGQVDMAGVQSVTTVGAEDLYIAFSGDEEMANKQYLGKTITVKGTVTEAVSEEGSTTITLKATESGSVSCKLDPLAQHARTEFVAGEQVTLKGICTGYLLDVVMERCIEVR